MTRPMQEAASYGDLMLRASMGVHAGVMWMQNYPLERRELAETAINDFRTALCALKEHTWALLELRRVDGILASEAPDPRERAAVRLGEVLDDFVKATPQYARELVNSRWSPSPWAIAARCVNAAGELIATHSDAFGWPRTPDLDAVLRNPAARQAGLAQVGDLVATLLGGADHLRLRAAQAGFTWPEVRYRLPDMSEVRVLARDVAGIGSLPTWTQLDDLTVARPPIRTADPAGEFSDRMLRLRCIAWEGARSEHAAVNTLQTFATLGIAVHAHALAFHGLPPAVLRAQPPIPARLASLVSRGRAWQEISRGLFEWRSAQPGDPVVEEDFARVSGLLRLFAPLSGDQPELSDSDRRHVGRAIAAAAAMTADIGTWNQATVTRMGRGNQIYVRAISLTGSQVTAAHALAEAKLAGRCAPADRVLIESTGALYTRTASKRPSALVGAEGLTLRTSPFLVDPSTTVGGRDPIERSQP